MPLKRSVEAPITDLNLVKFSMQDEATGSLVSCTVSEDALRKLIASGTSITPLAALFDMHRSEIESLASDMYDRGDSSPHVREGDV